MGRRGQQPLLDYDALHCLLWMRAEGEPIKVSQTDLAAELGVGQPLVHRALRAMIRVRRIEELTSRGGRNRTYLIHDPDDFDDDDWEP